MKSSLSRNLARLTAAILLASPVLAQTDGALAAPIAGIGLLALLFFLLTRFFF